MSPLANRQAKRKSQAVYDAINQEHMRLQRELVPGDTPDVDKILIFIKNTRRDAVDILDIVHLDHLRKILHHWAATVYDYVGYPSVKLAERPPTKR